MLNKTLTRVSLIVAVLFLGILILQLTVFRPPAWESMKVTVPPGDTPHEMFEQLRAASIRGDWQTVFGCLTMDAREELVRTLLMDTNDLRLRYARRSDPSLRFPLNEQELKLGKACEQLFQRRDITDERPHRNPSHIRDPDLFASQAWSALSIPYKPMIDENEQLGEIVMNGGHAFAPIQTSYRRQGPNKYYVHFKLRGGKWLIDEGPWWMPWGIHTRNRKPGRENRTSTLG